MIRDGNVFKVGAKIADFGGGSGRSANTT